MELVLTILGLILLIFLVRMLFKFLAFLWENIAVVLVIVLTLAVVGFIIYGLFFPNVPVWVPYVMMGLGAVTVIVGLCLFMKFVINCLSNWSYNFGEDCRQRLEFNVIREIQETRPTDSRAFVDRCMNDKFMKMCMSFIHFSRGNDKTRENWENIIIPLYKQY